MIEQVIKDICLNEEKANDIKLKAEKEGEKSVIDAEKKAIKIKNDYIEKAKVEKQKIISSATDKANSDYENGILQATKDSENFVKNLQDKVSVIAKEIVKGVVDGCK